MIEKYVPDRGDVVWLSIDPQVGREQAGRRPALVLSPIRYNGRVGLALVCPMTTKAKGYPFEVSIPAGQQVNGVVLADHVRSVDWRGRRASFLCRVPMEVLEEVRAKLEAVMDA